MSGISEEGARCTSCWPSWPPGQRLFHAFLFCVARAGPCRSEVLLSCVAGPLVGMHIEQRKMASYWMHKKGVTYRDVAGALQNLTHTAQDCIGPRATTACQVVVSHGNLVQVPTKPADAYQDASILDFSASWAT